MPPLTTIHTRRQQVTQTTAAGKNDRLNWSVLLRGITKANSPRAAEALVLQAAAKYADTHAMGGPNCNKLSGANTGTNPPSSSPSHNLSALRTTSTINYDSKSFWFFFGTLHYPRLQMFIKATIYSCRHAFTWWSLCIHTRHVMITMYSYAPRDDHPSRHVTITMYSYISRDDHDVFLRAT